MNAESSMKMRGILPLPMDHEKRGVIVIKALTEDLDGLGSVFESSTHFLHDLGQVTLPQLNKRTKVPKVGFRSLGSKPRFSESVLSWHLTPELSKAPKSWQV